MEDKKFFRWDAKGRLHQLPTNALKNEILTADGATLKLDNQKNLWKGVCDYQEHNGDSKFILVMALGSQCVSIYQKMSNKKTYLSEYWVEVKRKDLTAENMSAALKFSATALDFPSLKVVPVDIVGTHSFKSGASNVLFLAGYSYIDIWKMGR